MRLIKTARSTCTYALHSKTKPINSEYFPLVSEHSPSGIVGAHCGRLPPSSGDIRNPISQRLVKIPPRLSSFTLPSVSAAKVSGLGRLQIKRKEVRAGPSSGYPVSRYSFAPGSGGSFAPRIQGSGDSSMSGRNSLPTSFVIPTSVPVHGITQLGSRSHPTGLATPEATTTFLCSRSDKLVYTTTLIRPISPCQPTPAQAGTIFSHLRNPYLTIPILQYLRMPLHRGGAPIWEIPRFRVPGPVKTSSFINCLRLKAVTLGYSASGPPGHDRNRQHYWDL